MPTCVHKTLATCLIISLLLVMERETFCPIWTDLIIGYGKGDILSHLNRPSLLSQLPCFPRSSGLSKLHWCSAFPSQLFCDYLPATDQGKWAPAPGNLFSAFDVSWYLLRQQHVKANKLRSGWRCDKVSAPMVVPGLLQAPVQALSNPWVVADK